MENIFRDEALENQRFRLHGNVMIAVPKRHWLFSLALTFLVVLVAIFLFTGSYVRKERVRGFLVPDQGVVKVRAATRGIVAHCSVSSGDVVAIGDHLCTLSNRHGLPGERDRDSVVLEELGKKRKDTERLLEQWSSMFLLESERLRMEKESALRDLDDLGRLAETHRHRERLIEDRLAVAATLRDEGHLSNAEYRNLEALFLERHLELQRARYQINESRDAAARLENEIAQQPFKRELKRLELETKISEIDRSIAEIEARRQFVVRSPVSGRVTAFQAFNGQAVDPAVPLMAILPERARMAATLLVPGRAIGFVSPGQEVLLRYEAFPYQKFGLHRGRIEEISRTVLSPRELAEPAIASEPVYKVSASLERGKISAYGREVPLQAGMILEADIIQEKRSLLDWVLEPVYRFRGMI